MALNIASLSTWPIWPARANSCSFCISSSVAMAAAQATGWPE